MLNGGPLVELKTAQTVQTQNMFDLTIGGNTIGAGGALVSSGTLTLAAGNNVTLSQDGGNVITIIGGAGGAGTTFSAGVSNLSNDSGQTGIVTNQIVFAGGNNITLSQASVVGGSATVTIIGPNTVAQSSEPRVISINGSTGVIVLTAGNNITLSENLSTITISAFNQSVQPDQFNIIAAGTGGGAQTAGTASTVIFSDANNVSFGMANNSIVTASASFAQSAEPRVVAINGSSNAIVLTAGNNITLSENLSTITISAFNQSVQPAVAQINGTSGTFSIVQGNLISLSNNLGTITISNILSSSGIAVDVSSASSQGSLTARFAMADHAHRGLGVIYASGANGANSFYGPMTIATGNANITLSTGASALSIHGPTPGAGVAIADWFGNTITNSTVVFSFSNNVDFRLNGSTMTASAFVPAIGVSTGGNTCNTTGMFDNGSIVLQGGNNITLCMTTVTNQIHTIEIRGGGAAAIKYFENFGGIPLQPYTPAFSDTNGSYVSFQRILIPGNLTMDNISMIYALSGDSNSSGLLILKAALYSLGESTSSSVSTFFGGSTTSFSSTYFASLSTSIGRTFSWTSGSSATFPEQYGNASGTQYIEIPFTTGTGQLVTFNVSQGEYLFAFNVATTDIAGSFSIYGLSSLSINAISGSFNLQEVFHKGFYQNTATSGPFPNVISLSQITQTGASVLAQPYFVLQKAVTSAVLTA